MNYAAGWLNTQHNFLAWMAEPDIADWPSRCRLCVGRVDVGSAGAHLGPPRVIVESSEHTHPLELLDRFGRPPLRERDGVVDLTLAGRMPDYFATAAAHLVNRPGDVDPPTG